jgi:cobalt-zinc-cadmium efflux system outer membrane protein
MNWLRSSYWRELAFVLGVCIISSTNCFGADGCKDLSSIKGVLECALERHPIVRDASLIKDEATATVGVARQIPNPEVNNQTIWGGERNGRFYTELNFAHTIELGGKRSARIKRAEAEVQSGEATKVEARETVYLGTLVALYRLRQIQEELAAIDDALKTFARISKQYRSRPKLTPEQSASLRIFEIAEREYRLKRAPLEAEIDMRNRDLELAVGRQLETRPSLSPPHRRVWPALPGVTDQGGAKLKAARAVLQKTTAEVDVARGNAWPDLKIGPTVTIQRDLGQNYEAYGMNFTLPLPLYHRNAAGESLAQKSREHASMDLEIAKRENEDQSGYFKRRYETAVNALKYASTTDDLLKRHEDIERDFNRGFLNGTVVVEIHRQISDFLRSQNEQELAAIESYVRFNTLQGHLPEDFQ